MRTILRNYISHMSEANQMVLEEKFDVFDPEVTDYLYGKIIEAILVPTGAYYGRDFISRHPNLRVIGAPTTSDQYIDTAYCRSHGIKVVTLAGDPILQEITAVAELTICLIIALTRNVFPARQSVLNGEWNRYPFGGKRMLSKMALGVIGVGRIGDHVARIGSSIFHGVKIYDKDPEFAEMLPAHTFENVLDSDIITVHIPLQGNERMFNAEMFSRFKDGAYFINTSRGEIVDEQALIDALESGKLAGAATDVLSGEFEPGFDPNKNPLVQYARTHDNLIITPHIGGSTEDAWEMTQRRIIEKVVKVCESLD